MGDCSECNSDADATVSDSTDPTCFAPGYHSRGGYNKMVGNETPIAPLLPAAPLPIQPKMLTGSRDYIGLALCAYKFTPVRHTDYKP